MLKIEICDDQVDEYVCSGPMVNVWHKRKDVNNPLRLEAVPLTIKDHKYRGHIQAGPSICTLFEDNRQKNIDPHGDQNYQRGVFNWPKMFLVTELHAQAMPFDVGIDGASFIIGEKTMIHFNGTEFLSRSYKLQDALDNGMLIYSEQNFRISTYSYYQKGMMIYGRIGGWLLREIA